VARDDAGWLADYRPIAVDVSSLGKLASALRDEVELNFRPHVKRVMGVLDPGVQALPGRPDVGEWEAARGRYGDGRDQALYLLGAYERATLAIAEAAELIARRYQDSDAVARATVSDVRDAFAQAAAKYGLGGVSGA
jgi:hypothetical protein